MTMYFRQILLCSKKMVNQEITRGGFNFRHGSTYLTPYRPSAVRYALNNPFGSELVSTVFWLSERLLDQNITRTREIIGRYADLFSLQRVDSEPVLIEVSDARICDLLSENGEDPAETLTTMEQSAGSDLQAAMWQQLNFELIATINASRLKFYKISGTIDDGVFPEFDLIEI